MGRDVKSLVRGRGCSRYRFDDPHLAARTEASFFFFFCGIQSLLTTVQATSHRGAT